MEWTVRELAERAGISGRALRHYHRIGLLEPDRIGSNGYRYYGPDAVARLQRILLLRDTGMALGDIAAALDAPQTPASEIEALETHLTRLAHDRDTLNRRISTLEHTLQMRQQGRRPQMDLMLEGFNDRYESEVVERWGREAFEASNRWWHAKSVEQQREWQDSAQALLTRWAEIYDSGCTPDSLAAQHHATAHVAWFAEIPGTPTHAGDDDRSAAMVRGMADLYETDPDFQQSFGGPEAAQFAAAALRIHVL